eukprot:1470220-Rhodomonas_salina.1
MSCDAYGAWFATSGTGAWFAIAGSERVLHPGDGHALCRRQPRRGPSHGYQACECHRLSAHARCRLRETEGPVLFRHEPQP